MEGHIGYVIYRERMSKHANTLVRKADALIEI
jgi:hypothetical protein